MPECIGSVDPCWFIDAEPEFENCIAAAAEDGVKVTLHLAPIWFSHLGLTYLDVWLDPAPRAVNIETWPLGLGEVILDHRGHILGNLILASSARTDFVLKTFS